VGELEAHRGRIEIAKARRDIGRCADIESECQRRNQRQVGFGDPVEFRCELGSARRRRAKRVELNGEMAVLPDRVDERGGSGNFAKICGVGSDGGGGRRCAAELLCYAEELAPGFVDRRRVPTERLLLLGDVAVVVDAGDGQGSHDV
jgi:hypothetical protein